MYPQHLTQPMAQELIETGFEELKTAEQVENTLNNNEGTVFVMVNSVCGCAAGSARPGVRLALESSEKRPDVLATVFAGVDQEATAKAREFMAPYPPSSPSMALFKDGELVHFVERHHIEGRSADMIASHLKEVFSTFC